jgi:tetratricopeptide (TPR) repeat protein
VKAVLISLAAIFALAAIVGLACLCRGDASINFFPSDHRAEWILFPAAVEARARAVAELDTVFRCDFTAGLQTPKASLSLRAAKRAELLINDQNVALITPHNWKRISSADVSSLLHEGRNRIEVRVFNPNGPPAVWLSLTGDRLSLRSDQNWIASCAGSAWRQAILATSPRFPGPGNAIAGSERTTTVLTNIWPLWLLFGAVGLSFCAGAKWLFHRRLAGANRITLLIVLSFACLWLILFWHNAQLLPAAVGFDATHHLNYIKYLQENHRLPLPTEGVQMFQPPLYYFLSAVVLSLLHLSTADPSAILVLRALTMLFGISQILLVYASLRLIFPDRHSLQLIGSGLAAFLPMHLYISQYPTNETLAAVLVSASVYLTLRMMKRSSWRSYALLGLLLGAALLTKVTAILAVPFIILGLAKQLVYQRASLAKWGANFGSMIVIGTLTCSWHYLRISRHGSLLVGGSDPMTGLFWWQDDGYRTVAYFSRFGTSLVQPLFSVTASFMDGVYSTLWGDGLCSGVSDLSLRPPWNYGLMCGGYILSLLPMALLLAGVIAASLQLFRKLPAESSIMLGMCAALALALVYFNLKVPCYASVKAFYGLSALIPIAFLAAMGWNIVSRRSGLVQIVLGILFVVWATNSFASFWIYDPIAQHTNAAVYLSVEGKRDAALAQSRKAVAADPSNAVARIVLANILEEAGQSNQAVEEAVRATELGPADGASHLTLGTLLLKQGNLERTIEEARRTVAAAPENTHAHFLLLLGLFYHNDDLIDAARDALAISPFDAETHHILGAALMRKADAVEAFYQLSYSVLLKPDWKEARLDLHRALLSLINSSAASKLLHQVADATPESTAALGDLAWIFATHPNEELRDGHEAVHLAERACALTSRTDPTLLAILASAYAETGNFGEALNIIHESLSKARSSDNSDVIALAEKLQSLFQSNSAVREDPK